MDQRAISRVVWGIVCKSVSSFAFSDLLEHLLNQSPPEWPPREKFRAGHTTSIGSPHVRGDDDVDKYAEAVITSTTAIALHLMVKVDSQDAALLQAQEMWANKDKNKY